MCTLNSPFFLFSTGSQYHLVISRLNRQPKSLLFKRSKMFESKETKKRNGKYWEWDIYKSYKCIISLDICYAKNTRWWCYCVILNTSVVAWVLSNPSWKHSVWAFSSSCFPLPLQHQCAEAPHSIPCVGTKPRWYACMANSRVGLLLWHTSYFIPQDRGKERDSDPVCHLLT